VEDVPRLGKAGKKATPPDIDLNLEPLVEVLERKRTVTSTVTAPTTS